MTEQDVAAVVVAWLEALGADVYQEVECGSGVADIVARVVAEIWIVEVKTSPSLALLLQAMDRRREAHRVFIAAPYTRTFRRIGEVCGELGIGLWQVDSADYSIAPRVTEIVESRRWNTRPVALAKSLRAEHKTHAKAGASGGGRWTPFRDTCEQLARIVRAEPGIGIKAAVEQIKHHYKTPASARTSLVHWIERGRVEGIRLERQGCHAVLQPVEAKR